MQSGTQYLLDFNLLVHYVRRTSIWTTVNANHRLMTSEERPFFCVVTSGEFRSLAIQWRWGNQKLDAMEFCLGYFQVRTIDDYDVLRTYAKLDAYAVSRGTTMGKNDLWIAATAVVTGATLLTTDRDFDLFAPRFIKHVRIDPSTATNP